jgi:type IV secretion system protein VirB3
MTGVDRDALFVALTRPQMFAGVTYSWFVGNAILAAEAFLVFRSIWVLALALMIHIVGAAFCAREPRFFDLWLVRASKCPRVRNRGIWKCNSYQP